MRKRLGFILLMTIIAGRSYPVGGSVALIIPEKGSVSFETGIGASLRIYKDIVEIPLKLAYNKFHEVSVEGVPFANQAWFSADSLYLSAGLQLKCPIKNFYLKIFGNGLLNWNPYFSPLNGNIDRDIANYYQYESVFSTVSFDNRLGYGFSAGLGGGFVAGKLSLGLNVSYLHIISPVTLSGSYIYINNNSIGNETFSFPESNILIRGIKIELEGSVAL